MTLIVKKEDGTSYEWHDVVSYDFIDKDDIQSVADDYGVTLTDKQIENVGRICSNLERFPDNEDLRWIVKNILDE